VSFAKLEPIAIARLRVQRATGEVEFIYSYEPVSILDFHRWLRLHKHLAFMRAEDRRDG